MSSLEQLVLDGLALNDVTNYRLQSFDAPPPTKRYEWAQGGDADGAALVRDPLFENREIQARIRITQRSTMDLALAAVGAIVDKLEEAEQQPVGLDLVWAPADGTKSVTFKVLSGEVTGLPVTMDGDDAGWFKRSPVVTLTLTCKPFGYGTEVVGSSTSSATPFVTVTVASVTGDVPAEGRLIVTDAATQSRRYLEWGLEQRYYDPATSLLIDSDNMVVTGFAGAQTTRSGAYDPNAAGNNVIRASVFDVPTGVCGTGNQSHIGTFRVKARVFMGQPTTMFRFAWKDGESPYSTNRWVTPPMASAFAEIDLGLISIPVKAAGTQRWTGRVEAMTQIGVTDTVDVDYLVLVPAGEGYGRSSTPVNTAIAGTLRGQDSFTSAAGALNARVAPAGGTWATSGAATDFAGGTNDMVRTTISDASPRLAVLGSTNYTDMQVGVDFLFSGGAGQNAELGVIARFVDSSNYLFARFRVTTTQNFLEIGKVIAGATTIIGVLSPSSPLWESVYWRIYLSVTAGGQAVAEIFTGPGGALVDHVTATDSVLATGGTLASGKPGIRDMNPPADALTRSYDNFHFFELNPEGLVLAPGQSAEIRSDSVIQEDPTGVYWGDSPAYRGSRFIVPPAGATGRTSRILVKAHRFNIESGDAVNVTDNLTVQVAYTPRYLVVPR